MATIQKVKNKTGYSFRVLIRKNGQKTITKTFPNKTLARKFAADMELNFQAQDQYAFKDISFRELAIKYLQQASLGTRPKQKKMMTEFWIIKLGELKIIEIRTKQINEVLEKLKDTHAPSTINRYKATLSVIFNYGKRASIDIENPTSKIPALPENNARTRFLSHNELEILLRACKASNWPKLYLIVLMAITTGARRSELTNLRWTDIEIDEQVAYIRTSKNGLPRTLPLTNKVTEELNKLPREHKFVFHSDRIPSKPYDFTKLWLKALSEAQISDFRFHDLRHTCASYLAQGGASLIEIAEVLGHKQIQMTKRYSHLCISDKKKLINKHFFDVT